MLHSSSVNLASPVMTARVRQAVLFHLLTQSRFRVTNVPVPAQPIVKAVNRLLYGRDRKKADVTVFDPFAFDQIGQQWLLDIDASFTEIELPCPVSVALANLLDENHINFVAGGYTLNMSGLTEAVDNIKMLPGGKNATTVYLQGFLTPDNMRILKNHLAVKCNRSVALDEISDLIGNYLTRQMELDSMEKFLRIGQPPAISSLKLWVYRRALSTFRNEGRDALTRTVKGARTEQDLTGESLSVAIDGDSMLTGIYLTEGDDDLATGNDAALLDVADMTKIPGTENLEMQECYAVIERVLRQRQPAQAARLIRVLKLAGEGMQVQDIAAAEGCSRNLASVLLAEVRSVVMGITADGSKARQVLEYLSKEPCATSMDVFSDLGMEYMVVLPSLVKAGWAFKVSESGDTYQITDSGERLLKDTAPTIGTDTVAIFAEL